VVQVRSTSPEGNVIFAFSASASMITLPTTGVVKLTVNSHCPLDLVRLLLCESKSEIFVIEDDVRAGRLLILHAEYTYMASLDWVTRRGKLPSKPARAFLKLFREELARHEWTK
jgi:hypothetical protein